MYVLRCIIISIVNEIVVGDMLLDKVIDGKYLDISSYFWEEEYSGVNKKWEKLKTLFLTGFILRAQ